MPDAHDAYAALRNPSYRRLLIGSLLASTGNEMQSVAIGWELYERTNSAVYLGLAGLAQFVPMFLLALPAGHLADRFDRKRIVILTQIGMAVTSLGLAAISYTTGPVYLIYLFLCCAGSCQAYSFPARWALLPGVVSGDELHNAITWGSSSWQIASVIGPAAGGLLIAATRHAHIQHAAFNYLLAATCALACAGLVARVAVRPAESIRETMSYQSLLRGLRFVWETKPILATITLDLFSVLLGGATALLPIFATDILHAGPTGLGWLRAAPSLGALAMALALAHRPPLRRPGIVLLWAVAGFGVATIGFGLSRFFWLSLVCLFLTGAFDNISVVVRGTLVQVLTPDSLRGRVTAVNAVFIVSSNELGAFESGITAQFFGPIVSAVGGGIGTILVVLAVAFIWPQVLRLGALKPRNHDTSSGEETPLASGRNAL
ncbi:MAG TPA: MFS transporter [Gemmataceae bacterium]|jgi:MFS family permease|nr:MFS transporter [Gemmataceae bacterium]